MKTANITVRATPETKARLKAICKEENRSQADQIAWWIKKHKT